MPTARKKTRRRKVNRSTLTLCLITFGVGLVSFAIFLVIELSQRNFIARSVPVDVRVVSSTIGGTRGSTYLLRFEADLNGTTISHLSNVRTNPQPHRPGDIVPGRIALDGSDIRTDKMMRWSWYVKGFLLFFTACWWGITAFIARW